MKVALTGSSGFLGCRVAFEARVRGHEVVPIRLAGNVTAPNAESLRPLLEPARNCDVLVNCAAAITPRDAIDHFTNAQAPALMAGTMAEAGGWMLHVGSANVDLPALRDAYSEGKRLAERELTGRAGTRIVNPGLIWSWEDEGPGARVLAMRRHWLPVVPVPCPGNTYRPVGVGALAAALCDALEAGPGGPPRLTIMGDRRVSLFQLCRDLLRHHGGAALPLPTGPLRLLPRRLRAMLGRSVTLQQLLATDRSLDGLPVRGERLLLAFTGPHGEAT